MAMEGIQFIILNLLLPISLATTILHKGPVGISMCEQICFNTNDCEIFTFLPVHLVCFKGNITITSEGKSVVRRLQKSTKMKTSNCQFGSKSFKSRSSNKVCRQEKESKYLAPSPVLNKLHMKGYKEIRKRNTIYLYKMFQNHMSWNKAMKECRLDGGLLAQVEDEFKWDFVKSIVRLPEHSTCAWLGLRDQPGKDHLVWEDGTGFRHKERLAQNYVKAGNWMLPTNRNCACMNNAFKLFKLPCFFANAFICEVVSAQN